MSIHRVALCVGFKWKIIVGLILVLTIVRILVPAKLSYRGRFGDRQRRDCVSTLRQLDAAVQQWALENKKKPQDLVTMSNAMEYINPKIRIECPSSGKYTIGPAVSNLPTCSISGHALPP